MPFEQQLFLKTCQSYFGMFSSVFFLETNVRIPVDHGSMGRNTKSCSTTEQKKCLVNAETECQIQERTCKCGCIT